MSIQYSLHYINPTRRICVIGHATTLLRPIGLVVLTVPGQGTGNVTEKGTENVTNAGANATSLVRSASGVAAGIAATGTVLVNDPTGTGITTVNVNETGIEGAMEIDTVEKGMVKAATVKETASARTGTIGIADANAMMRWRTSQRIVRKGSGKVTVWSRRFPHPRHLQVYLHHHLRWATARVSALTNPATTADMGTGQNLLTS